MKIIKNQIKFANELSNWYRENKRDLPFRKTRDPYKIFISELMLQQTQVDTVIPYYLRFVDTFPTIQALADAKIEQVLKIWEGLGYYRRACYIHETAQMIVKDFNGVFPNALKDIERLKGVGRYTARAIDSIAYDNPSPAVDGNVMRVMSRVMLYDKDISKTKHMREIEHEVAKLIVHEIPSDFTQAMMELGALICTKNPDCKSCPIKSHCFAYKQNLQNEFPKKSKLKDKTHETFSVIVLKSQNKVLLTQRPKQGLLANMYEIPQFESQDLTKVKLEFNDKFKTTIQSLEPLFSFDHIFTHKVWHLHVYQAVVSSIKHLTLFELKDFPYAISKAHLKIIENL